MYGVNCKATNPEYRKKKCTKLSVISDESKNIISINYDSTHLSPQNNVSFNHDLLMVQNNLDDMFINLPMDKIIKLCGDKGYISRKRFRLNNNRRIKIISPKRKNQRTRNTSKEKELLKKRRIVEITLAKLKKYNRVVIRRDKLIDTYMGFIFLALFDIWIK